MDILFLIAALICFAIASFAGSRWPNFPLHWGWLGAAVLTLGIIVTRVA